MSWLALLANELAARGVALKERRGIVFELQDHIACEPGCEERLGDPRELAARFADELATDRARRCALVVFGALAVAALALIGSQLATGAAGGYPGFDRGRSLALFFPAAVGMFLASQGALVAGTLAALRALRRRHASVIPAEEIALIRRRAWVGLGAGLATMVGLELYVIDFSAVLPGWWVSLLAGLAGLAAVVLLAAAATLVRADSIVVGATGPAGDIFADLPPLRSAWLQGRPRRLGGLACAGVTLTVTVLAWRAERSLVEGIERGVLEGLAAVIGFTALGARIGALADRQEPAPSESHLGR